MNNELAFDILKDINEAIIALDLSGKILFWNNSAERLLGYNSNEVINKYIPIISNQSKYELDYALEKAKEKQQFSFRTCKKNKSGIVLDLIFVTSPILRNNAVIGISIWIQETSLLKKVCYIPLDLGESEREQKRTFEEIRNLILITLLENQKTINQLANDSGINWRTVEKHLTFLIGKKLVEEILSSKYVRIFELTNSGKVYLLNLKKSREERFLKRE